MKQVKHSDIETFAYAIWERQGRPEGRSEAHWHEAETQLRAESGLRGDVAKLDGDYTEQPYEQDAPDVPSSAGRASRR